MHPFPHRASVLVVAAAFGLAAAAPAHAQLGSLISPGPLAKAHSAIEGAQNCEKCHERGRQVTAAKCLACHAPIAQRIARRTGVHRDVTDDCISCHADHAGVDGQLRPFDTMRFNHAAATGYALAGRHATAAVTCASCHKTRSFLTASRACATCHTDPHKGALGATCETCHLMDASFAAAATRFDHSRTAFALTGAHVTATCAGCHKTRDYKVAHASACVTCHATPHGASVSRTCPTCHTTETWHTRTFDHVRTAFPLVGRHATVACAGCHKQPAAKVKPAAGTCAACHADPHRGGFKADCKACHNENGFLGARFDHLAATGYALADAHAGLACRQCHTSMSAAGTPPADLALDFRGLTRACAGCHADPHKASLGSTCERCHSVKSFAVTAYTHTQSLDLFTGQHARVACSACHQRATAASPPAFAGTSAACASCHRDPHLGQFAADCVTCHSVNAAAFAADRFTHDRAGYALTGRHQTLACASCHTPATTSFPAGAGTTTRYRGVGVTCASCHQDVHLAQLGAACDTCHTTSGFTVMAYTHRKPTPDFFTGRHLKATCAACHRSTTKAFPSGRGTAIDFSVSRTCTACHADPHQGALGLDCARCHKPIPASLASARPIRARAGEGVRP